jgi:hypothetical protein
VVRVQSPVDLDPSITREQYRQLFSAPPEFVPAEIRTALGQMVGAPRRGHEREQSELEVESDDARATRAHDPHLASAVPGDETRSCRDAPPFDLDFIARWWSTDAPRVVGFVVVATYVVLVLLLGSVVLPSRR